MRRVALLFFVALVFIPRAAWPQGTPLGPEFRVNSYTTGYQMLPSVAADAGGNFVVVWDGPDGSGYGIFGQRYASSGAPLGPEFRVNTYTTNQQRLPSVATDSSGNFVIVWHSEQDPLVGIFGQRYASSGAPLGPEFHVNTFTTSYQVGPSVAADPAGNFVVIWASYQQDGSAFGIFGQRYASSGAPLGPEFRVNTYTTNYQRIPSVATDSSGNFVVVWESFQQDGSGYGIFGQRYASSGAPLGPEFRANTYTTSTQDSPAVASDASGNFIVAWGMVMDADHTGVFGQRYASSGIPMGPEFRVNSFTSGYGYSAHPSVAADASGNFVVVYDYYREDGSSYGVFGQRFTTSGAPSGTEFRVNTYTTFFQRIPSVAADPSGNFVVVWYSFQDGWGSGVYGQRYSQIVPVELMHFGIE